MRQTRASSAKAPRRKEKEVPVGDADIRIKIMVLGGMLKYFQAFTERFIHDARNGEPVNKISLNRIKTEILVNLKASTVGGLDNDQQVLLYFNRCEKGLRQLIDEAIREGMKDEEAKPI
jgi:hypothetical protein